MKSKSIAIILALFFSFWSWLYTYKRNLVKFWISLSLNIAAAIAIFMAGIIFINITTEGHPEFIGYLRGFETFFYSDSINIPEESYRTFSVIILTLSLMGIFKIGVWIWALIDNAIKSRKFYTGYSTSR